MMLMTKQQEPPKPTEAPKVIEACKAKEAAIQVQAEARAKRDRLRRILADPDADPAEKIRARLALPDAEVAVELAEIAANEKQKIGRARLQEAVEAWRPVFEGRFREALRGLYAALEKHVSPANERARQVWLEAYSMGVELPPHFWPELLSNDNGGGGVEPLLAFRRRLLQTEKWI